MLKLFIKLPTRSRPTKVLDLTQKYIDFASGDPFSFGLAIHSEQADPTMHTEEVRTRITELTAAAHAKNIELFTIEHNGKTKVDAYNANPGHLCADWDIQVATSDDMFPVVEGYDRVIRRAMKVRCPDLDGVLHFNDGFRPELMTLPIVGRAWYDHYGWIYNPRYVSLFCDNEMQEVSKMLDKYHYVDQCIIEHRHPLWVGEKYDDLMKHTESFYKRDGSIYERRKARNFNLVATNRKGSLEQPLFTRQMERREAGPATQS